MNDYKRKEDLAAIDHGYARSHALSYMGMSTFKEDAIIEEEIECLNLKLSEKFDTKSHFE